MSGNQSDQGLVTSGLFAGIGGIEAGLERAGHRTALLVENLPAAQEVLRTWFPDAKLETDVRDLTHLPEETQLLTAGFPCQDLSSVGPKVGIKGTKSSLVGELFRLIAKRPVNWILLENVPFLLHLDKGRALRLIVSALDELGYNWAYRVVDSEAFGLAQRRRRWFLLASLEGDPRSVLLSDQEERPERSTSGPIAYGFYWTEGTRALGWAVDSVPPIKVGSTIGVASPPAILRTNGEIVTPDIRDAERLQGFPEDWTEPAETVARPSTRWQLVGNAVSVPVAEWIGKRLLRPRRYDSSVDREITGQEKWPKAAWSQDGRRFAAAVSDTPLWLDRPHLEDFMQYEGKPLSARAAEGFLRRALKGNLRFADGFLDAVRAHAERQRVER